MQYITSRSGTFLIFSDGCRSSCTSKLRKFFEPHHQITKPNSKEIVVIIIIIIIIIISTTVVCDNNLKI